MWQKLNRKNSLGQDLYQEVCITDKSTNHIKVFGEIGTLQELQKKRPPETIKQVARKLNKRKH